jgi:hypothetical protein
VYQRGEIESTWIVAHRIGETLRGMGDAVEARSGGRTRLLRIPEQVVEIPLGRIYNQVKAILSPALEPVVHHLI